MSQLRPDRASYLARRLISRLRDLEGARQDDAERNDHREVGSRQDMVTKVLAVEAGVTDGSTVKLVANALPRIYPAQPTLDRDVAELAAFLRVQLKL
jgi:hypothetical protein